MNPHYRYKYHTREEISEHERIKKEKEEYAKALDEQIIEKKRLENLKKMKEQEFDQRYNYNIRNLNPGYVQPSPIIGNKPIFKDYEYINAVNIIRIKIKLIEAEIERGKNSNTYLKFMLKKHLEEKKKLEEELNLRRDKNYDLVHDLEAELNKNKQLERVLEENIKNVQGQTLENEYQEIYYKIKYLQKKYEEVIDNNREMSINDINGEEKEANYYSRNNYNNNGLYNTLEIELNKLNNLEEDLKGEEEISQFFKKKVNEKDLNMNNLHELIEEEKKLYNELRRILMDIKEKNKNLRSKIKSQISEKEKLKKKCEEVERKNQILIQEKEELTNKNENYYSIIQNQIKEIQELKKKLREKEKKCVANA